MHEVVALVVTEAGPLPEATRAGVDRGGEGNELGEAEDFEGVTLGDLGGGEGEAASPELAAEAPADLDARREVRGEARFGESVNPAKAPSISTAQRPRPRSAIPARRRSNDARDSSKESGAGK